MLLACNVCKTEFNAVNPEQRFCSGKCYDNFMKYFNPEKKCIGRCLKCGKIIYTEAPNDFCSKECEDYIKEHGLF